MPILEQTYKSLNFHPFWYKKGIVERKKPNFSLQSSRVLNLADILRANGVVQTDADFCRAVKFDPSSFNQIRKRKRNAPVELIVAVCEVFGANPAYVILGIGRKFDVEDVIRRKLLSTTEKSGSEKEVVKRIKSVLGNSIFLKGILRHRYWHDRIDYMVYVINRLETESVSNSHEITTLKKVISDNMLKVKLFKDN